jgi:hypothetical protein
MRSFRIDRNVVPRALAARALVFASFLAGAIALTLCWQAAFTSIAGASETSSKLAPPSVSTGTSHASGSGVELEGMVNPKGEATTYYFQYGPTLSYGSQSASASLPTGKTKVKVSQTVTGLLDGYHYRLVASNSQGLANGHDRTYTVKKPKTTPKRLTLKLTLAKPPAEGQVVGSPVTIQGTLSGPGATGRGVVLQSSPYPTGATFTNVGAQQTVSSTGRFSFFIAHLSRSTRFRVATVGSPPTYSPIITELASVRVTLHVRTAPHAGLVRLYGTVSPSVSGAIVYFQMQRASKPPKITTPKSGKAEEKAEERAETVKYATEFSTPLKRATRTISRFSIVTGIRKAGLYRAYVQVPKGPLASGYSTSVTLRATAKKKSKRKG